MHGSKHVELAELTTVEIRKMSAADMKETEESAREQLALAKLRAPLDKEGIKSVSTASCGGCWHACYLRTEQKDVKNRARWKR